MKQVIIADSSALFSLLIDTDNNYRKAVKIKEQYLKQGGLIVVPSEIFSELINILGKKFNHKAAVWAAKAVLGSKTFTIENTSESARNTALEKFKNQPKKVSFTDCLVMAYADFYETREIFGFDEILNTVKLIGVSDNAHDLHRHAVDDATMSIPAFVRHVSPCGRRIKGVI